MEFNSVEEGKVYYAVTEGQFIGIFFCIKKGQSSAMFISDYYGGPAIKEVLDKLDFDWPEILDEEDDLPEKSFASDMMSIKHYRGYISESIREIIKTYFETS